MKKLLTIALILLTLLMVSGLAQKNLTTTKWDSTALITTIGLDTVEWIGFDNIPYMSYKVKFAGNNEGKTTFHWGTPIEIKITKSAIELMFEYAEYCYNDSTYLFVNVFKETNRQEAYPFAGRPEIITGYYEYEHKWQHKQPTFKGFIEWLKLKRRL